MTDPVVTLAGHDYTVVRLSVFDGWNAEYKDNLTPDLYVERRRQADGSFRWVVFYDNYVVTRNGEPVRDPSPSWRTDEHMAATRFATLEEALLVAHHTLPLVQAQYAERLGQWLEQKKEA